MGPYPAAAAAAAPALDPPGVHAGFQGLRVVGCRLETPDVNKPQSGILVLATTTAPASRSRATTGASAVAGTSSAAAVPSGVGTPALAMFSLTVTGTPSSGPRGRPVRHRSAAAGASVSAVASSRCDVAWTTGSHASMRARTDRHTATGSIAPSA